MPDISMCTNSACPLSKDCYRHMAVPSFWQAYAGFAPGEDGSCDWFMPIESREICTMARRGYVSAPERAESLDSPSDPGND